LASLPLQWRWESGSPQLFSSGSYCWFAIEDQLGSRTLDLFFSLSVTRATASTRFMERAMGTEPTLRNLGSHCTSCLPPSRQPAFQGRTSERHPGSTRERSSPSCPYEGIFKGRKLVAALRLMNFFPSFATRTLGVRVPSRPPDFFQFLAGPQASLVTNLVLEETRRSKEAILTSDRVFHWLTRKRSASPILPTAPAPDPRLSLAELSPSKFVSR
jgi:hypothetical protein